MRKVLKYEILLVDEYQTLKLPCSSFFVHCGEQDGRLFAWFDTREDGQECEIYIQVFGTGHTIPDYPLAHMGSVQMKNGLVWHIYKRYSGEKE